ncbi:MAG: pantoate--beta-alanine ligase [Desulfotomaculales bacterium]
MREFVRAAKRRGETIGFVPTMGYFHEGHLTLMREAKKTCGTVVVSIFVNPLQFGPREDFREYPRDFARDEKMAREVGVDALFAPTVEEMYPEGFTTFVEVAKLTDCLCGLSRPGHFRGVATVVTKLFNIVLPDKAFFGQKDAQQVLVVRRMVRDLNMPLTVVAVPTVREPDGLAMSSRNVYLSPREREAARVLYRSLKKAEEAVARGERDAEKILRQVREELAGEPLAAVDYAEIRSLPDLKETPVLAGPALLALAVRIGKTRLIDNTVLDPGGTADAFNLV